MGCFHIIPHPVAGVPSDNILFHWYFDKLINGAVGKRNIFQYFWQYIVAGSHLVTSFVSTGFLRLTLRTGSHLGWWWDDAGGYHPERLQVLSRPSAQVKKSPHLLYSSRRRCDAAWETAGEMHQPSAFILKATANTNWKTKTMKNNLFHPLLARARTVSFSLSSSQTQCPQRLLQRASSQQLSAPTRRGNAGGRRPREPLPPLHIPPWGVTHTHPAHPEHPGPSCWWKS